jgi:hypothetical protein
MLHPLVAQDDDGDLALQKDIVRRRRFQLAGGDHADGASVCHDDRADVRERLTFRRSAATTVLTVEDLIAGPMKAIPVAALTTFVVAIPLSYLVAARIGRTRTTKPMA